MQIFENYDLSQLLWYKIGGKTRYLLVCESQRDVEEALDFLRTKNVTKFFIVGIGANILFSDEYFDGAIIQFADPNGTSIKQIDETTVEAFAGEMLDQVIQFGFANHLVGLAWAGGLPGTVGAAIRGNVGAFGGEIKDRTISVDLVDLTKGTHHIEKLTNGAMHFSYRHSIVKENRQLIVLSARFKLLPATDEELEQAKQIYQKNIEYRQTHHPHDFPNSGSTFKNVLKKDDVAKVLAVWPDIKELVDNNWHGKVAMGYIIGRLGFAGYQVGNAQVSTQHQNFINNLGGAKAADVKAIIYAIQRQCEEMFGFTPETEVEIVE